MNAKPLKTVAVLAALLLLNSCNHNSPAPAQPTPVTPVPTTPTLNTTEQALLGNWIYDKQELYNNGVIPPGPGGTYSFNDPAVYHIQFNSTAGPLTQYKECINGTSGSDIRTNWEVTSNGKLYIQSTTYTIDSLSAHFLAYYTGSLTSGAGVKYSFHK